MTTKDITNKMRCQKLEELYEQNPGNPIETILIRLAQEQQKEIEAIRERIEALQKQVRELMKDSEPVHDMSDEMVKALFDRVNKKYKK